MAFVELTDGSILNINSIERAYPQSDGETSILKTDQTYVRTHFSTEMIEGLAATCIPNTIGAVGLTKDTSGIGVKALKWPIVGWTIFGSGALPISIDGHAFESILMPDGSVVSSNGETIHSSLQEWINDGPQD